MTSKIAYPKQSFGRALAAAALILTLGAAPPPDQRRQTDDIVVTGEHLSPEKARERATAYVRGIGVTTNVQAVARWIDPVCPKAIGISPANAQAVETRVRAIAQAARVPLAIAPCISNVTIAFVSDAGATVRGIASRERRSMAEVTLERRTALLDGDAPVRWWYSTELRGRHGDRATDFQPPAVQLEGGGSLPSGLPFLSHYNSSIVSTQTVRALRSATIIVDVDRAEGVALDAVSSYAALVAFAEISAIAVPPPSSILALFDSNRNTRDVSEWDARFLRELYRLPLDRLARYQRGRLVGALLRENTMP